MDPVWLYPLSANFERTEVSSHFVDFVPENKNENIEKNSNTKSHWLDQIQKGTVEANRPYDISLTPSSQGSLLTSLWRFIAAWGQIE